MLREVAFVGFSSLFFDNRHSESVKNLCPEVNDRWTDDDAIFRSAELRARENVWIKYREFLVYGIFDTKAQYQHA